MSQLGTRKSRKGCMRCKERRVKCDENSPCGNCARRGEECSLLESTLLPSDHPLEPGLPTTAQEWTQDLELMHHLSSIESRSSATRENIYSVWTEYIPKQAFKHPWLAHGILATSAFHLAYRDRDRSAHYLQLSDKHQAIALKTYRSILATDINPDNSNALFGLASILSVSTMARANEEARTSDPPGTMSIDSIIEFFYLCRGISEVVRMTREYINRGPMATVLDRQLRPPDAAVVLPPAVLQQFVSLQQMLQAEDVDPEAAAHCHEAVTLLRGVYEEIAYFAPKAVEMDAIWHWPIHVSSGFVRLIHASFPPALVIFAYFAVALSCVRKTWFNQSWGEYAVNGVAFALGEDMQSWIEWPRWNINDRIAVFGVNGPPELTTNDLPFHS